MSSQVDQFIDLLQGCRFNGSVENPWRDWDRDNDTDKYAPRDRSKYLRAYLNARLNTAEALLIAEAPSYQGAKFSGIPMTCERTLLGHRRFPVEMFFDEAIKPQRTSRPEASSKEAVRQRGFCEPTAGYVWGQMADRPGLSKKIVLWNVFAFHPYEDTDTLTNRRPQDPEIRNSQNILEAFLRLFPDLPVLSIGKVSERYLKEWLPRRNLSCARHPANGGGAEFRKDFGRFLKRVGLST
jgi:hypothetical protein